MNGWKVTAAGAFGFRDRLVSSVAYPGVLDILDGGRPVIDAPLRSRALLAGKNCVRMDDTVRLAAPIVMRTGVRRCPAAEILVADQPLRCR